VSEPWIVDGQYLGELEVVDGVAVAFDPQSGRVLRAVNAAGEDVPTDQFEVQQGDRMGELLERLDALEQRAAQPRPTAPSWEQAEAVNRRAGEAFVDELESAEKIRGHAFTRSETTKLVERGRQDHHNGKRADVYEAWARAEAEGDHLHDLETHAGRTAWMAERLADGERDARGQGHDEPDPPSRELYDLDNRVERQAYLLDRMNDRADASSTFSSRELAANAVDDWEESTE